MERPLRFLFVGLGSIGLQHVRNLAALLDERDRPFELDVLRSGAGRPVPPDVEVRIAHSFTDPADVPFGYDAAFVTNPTHLHYDTIRRFVSKTRDMFIEKPLFDDPSLDPAGLGLSPDGVYYVACPLRYTGVVKTLKDLVGRERVISARAICSSYLPEWRPGQDYRKTYSAHRDQGGGVPVDLIHEWDYLVHLFGPPDTVQSLRGTFSRLEIDSDDLALYLARYPGLAVELHLDYFGRKTIREIQLFTEDDTIVGDLVGAEVRWLRSGECIAFTESRVDWQKREISYFLDLMDRKADNWNDVPTALSTLRIATQA